MIPPSFFRELEKTAVSMGKTLAAVQRRISQGALVGPRSLSELEAGARAGLVHTPREARRTALYAAEGGRDAVKMQRAVNNPVTVAARARLDEGSRAAREMRPGVYDRTKPLPDHYDHGPNPAAGFGYTKAHIDQMAGNSQVYDPKKLMLRSSPAALAPTLPASAGGTAATALRNPVRARRQPVARGGTAVTAVDRPLALGRT